MTEKEALVIGIDAYESAPLTTAANDATDVAALLQMPEFGYRVTTLLDDDASRPRIQAEIGRLLQSSAGIVVIYFAGHATAGNAERASGSGASRSPALRAFGSAEDDPALPFDLIYRMLDVGRKSQTIVLLLDCCHAGAGYADSVQRALDKGGFENALGPFRHRAAILGACGALDLASTPQGERNSPFTKHLILGSLGGASDEHGHVSVPRLFSYVAEALTGEGFPPPVLQGEIVGNLMLATGVRTTNPVLDTEARLAALEDEAEGHYEAYLSRTSTSYADWKTSGFQTACQLLAPVLDWFARTGLAHPELVRRTRFRDASSAAQAKLEQLGALHSGLVFSQGWRVDERVGDGSFGTVWKCIDETSADAVAYKAYHSHELLITAKRRLFRRGYDAMRLLNHPRIVKVREYTECPVGFFMDFVPGVDLRKFDMLSQLDGPGTVLRYLVELAETIQHAHFRGVYHRDIKPENIIMAYDDATARWYPYLTDFDLAWFSTASLVTKEPFGAVYYASPEQRRTPSSAAVHRPTTDVFAFGQLCYYVLTRQDPVLDDNSGVLRERLRDWPTEAAAKLMLQLYVECTLHRPEQRVQSFRDVANRLFEIQQELALAGEESRAIETGQFLRELRFTLVGLAFENAEQPYVTTASGRTQLYFEAKTRTGSVLDLEVRIERIEPLAFSGQEHEHGRIMINRDLDAMLRSFPGVQRRSGTYGPFECYLDIKGLPRTLESVRRARDIVARAIDIVERG